VPTPTAARCAASTGRWGAFRSALKQHMCAGTARTDPDEVANGLALCALHHALLDLGVLGITADRRIQVSHLYVARSDAGRAVDALAGQPLLSSRPGRPSVDLIFVDWHTVQVFKGQPGAMDGRSA
jgi:predicted restriction endonuclease